MVFSGSETLRKIIHHYHTFLHPQIYETSLDTLKTWEVHVDIVTVKKRVCGKAYRWTFTIFTPVHSVHKCMRYERKFRHGIWTPEELRGKKSMPYGKRKFKYSFSKRIFQKSRDMKSKLTHTHTRTYTLNTGEIHKKWLTLRRSNPLAISKLYTLLHNRKLYKS